MGNISLAKHDVQSAIALSNGKDVRAMSAIAMGLAGDSAQANRLSGDLSKNFTEDTIVQFNYLPAIRAAAALRSGDPSKSIDMLAAAVPYELGGTA